MKPVRLILSLGLLFASGGALATTQVQHLRLWEAPDTTRLVLDLSGPLEHRYFALKNPDRLVIDLDGARLTGALPAPGSGRVVSGIRAAPGEKGVRIVIDLKTEVRPSTFLLKPYEQYGHRLVIDLHDAQAERQAVILAPKAESRDLVIAIDAGHGGEDPGAIGRRHRTREKDVVLAIARELYRLIASEPGMKPVMVRDGDYYIALSERVRKAHRLGADVFISIHADSIPGRHARGSSVYALSERGATSVLAKALADKENAADFIGGASEDVKDGDVLKVLADLKQTAAIADSLDLGSDVLASLQAVGPLHANTVNQAGFAVLKSAHFPSVLVETAFISNPAEEQQLRDKSYQRKVARGIFNGLKRAAPRLIARRSPALPVAARVTAPASGEARQHVVKKGETLEQIARQYEVHVDVLRFFNNLGSSNLKPGLRLNIPGAGGNT